MYRDEDGDKVPFIHLQTKYVSKRELRYSNKSEKKENTIDNNFYKNPKITYGMVVLVKENDNLYYIIDRKNNVIKAVKINRKKENNLPFPKMRSIVDVATDYVDFKNVKEFDVDEVAGIEYFVSNKDNTIILQKYKNFLKNEKIKKENNSSDLLNLKFGDILSFKNTKEKSIFICRRKKQIYTCPFSAIEQFTGIYKINKNFVIGKYDEISEKEKIALIKSLEKALELDKFVPETVKDKVSTLVKLK